MKFVLTPFFSKKFVLTPFSFFVLLAFLAGCSTTPSTDLPPQPSARTASKNVAVVGLVRSARQDTEAGRLANAAATLERAVRIEPRNPRLWHELARVRLRQGEFDQAASLAARSNSWAGSDADLRAANQRIIDNARAWYRR
jgi:Tfp pilus assembly protein PilF